MSLSRIHHSQIRKLELDELRELLSDISMDVITTMGAYQEEEDGPIEFDWDFYLHRYFKRHPTPKFERLLEAWRELTGADWFEDF